MPEHIGENELITAHVFQDVSETWLYRSCGLSRWQMGILLFSPTLKCPEFKTEAYILKNCSALEWKSSYNFRRDWQTFWIWIKEEEQAARADQECLRARSRKDGHPSLKREREREREPPFLRLLFHSGPQWLRWHPPILVKACLCSQSAEC